MYAIGLIVQYESAMKWWAKLRQKKQSLKFYLVREVQSQSSYDWLKPGSGNGGIS